MPASNLANTDADFSSTAFPAPRGVETLSMQMEPSVSPASSSVPTILFRGSNDGTTWFNLSTACAAATLVTTQNAYQFYNVKGTSISATVRCVLAWRSSGF